MDLDVNDGLAPSHVVEYLETRIEDYPILRDIQSTGRPES